MILQAPQFTILSLINEDSSCLRGRDRDKKLSRQALKEAIGCLDPEPISTDLDEFFGPIAYPHLCSSLSHTKNYACALVGLRDKFHSVGIDVENRNRELPDGALRYFINSADASHHQPIDLWGIKEASFKACWTAMARLNRPRPKLLKEIIVKNDQFFFQDLCGSIGPIDHPSLRLWVATIPKAIDL